MNIGTKNRVPLKVNIPYYQRPHRWDEKRITNLISDFYKNKNENKSADYFVVSVLLVEDEKIQNRYDIIDGQQRVTTVFLLNYLRFLLQRSYVEELISTKGSNLDGPLYDLQEIYGNLFGSKYLDAFAKMRGDIIEKMEPLSDLTDSERDQATLVDMEPNDIDKINKIFDDAICVDSALIENLEHQIWMAEKSNNKEKKTWDETITSMFTPHIETLFSYELPEIFALSKGEYFSFLDEKYDGDINKFREMVRWSNAYLWLLEEMLSKC